MGWFTRFTRFGDMHIVFSQEGDNACGIACTMMCVFKINKLTPGVQASYAEQQIYTRYSIASHGPYNGTAYTYASHLAKTLNGLSCGTWEAKDVGQDNVSQAILDSCGTDIVGAGPLINAIHRNWPIIVLVGWNAGGAHFVVVDTVNNFAGTTYASVNDPWDGDVHITEFEAGQPFVYTGTRQPYSWSLGSGPEHQYGSPNDGAANGWIVRRTA